MLKMQAHEDLKVSPTQLSDLIYISRMYDGSRYTITLSYYWNGMLTIQPILCHH